ncbi:MAG: YggS family pyridoxal phosphate-dependent enzyme [Candidatus Omnitrophota bacterium]|nr:YggS family pyridoxal phosphate-dependent enzyme [Candidatus Omnitrophota bacterium]
MIKEKTKKILSRLPEGVELVAAAKGRSPEEVLEAIEGGIKIVGENYVQEALEAFKVIGRKVKWHFLGHLQKNKVKKAVEIFDMIETVDSFETAKEIDKKCRQASKIMPILIEVNSGRETEKYGVLPQNTLALIKQISGLSVLKIKGLMTMGPYFDNPEDYRQCFKVVKKLFQEIKILDLAGIEMKYLSMGMTGSYQVAVEEGANIIRVGTGIFGKRSRKGEF